MHRAEKYIKRVETIEANVSAFAAAHHMAERAVGSLVVVDDEERPVGIVTDRDLCVRGVAHSNAPADLSITELMTKDPICVAPGDGLHDVLILMRKNGIRRVPVVAKGRVVGMVSLNDIFCEFANDVHDLALESRGKFRRSPVQGRFEHVRTGVERSMNELKSRLEYAQWYARDTLMAELDELRDRLKGHEA